jgi:cytochrome c553
MFGGRAGAFAIGTSLVWHLLDATCAMADDAKLKAYGEYLSRECTTCHRIDGTDNGIPSIIGWDSEQFITTLKFYKDGLRGNPAMISVAKSLDEEQVRALATYFGSLPPPPRKKSAPPARTK